MIETEENIKIVVRIRPIQQHEKQKGEKSSIKPIDDGRQVQVIAFQFCIKLFHWLFCWLKIKVGPLEAKNFRCTQCFSKTISQETFFQNCGIIELLDSVPSGYRSCLFAFGQVCLNPCANDGTLFSFILQTGSGKTHSVIGAHRQFQPDSSGDGLLGRSLNYLYDKLESLQVRRTHLFTLIHCHRFILLRFKRRNSHCGYPALKSIMKASLICLWMSLRDSLYLCGNMRVTASLSKGVVWYRVPIEKLLWEHWLLLCVTVKSENMIWTVG